MEHNYSSTDMEYSSISATIEEAVVEVPGIEVERCTTPLCSPTGNFVYIIFICMIK